MFYVRTRNMKKIEQLSPEQLIKIIFEPLSEQDKSLPSRISQYILQGDELEVLGDFDKLCQTSKTAYKIYEYMRRPCELYSVATFSKTHEAEQARLEFYRRWTGTFSLEQIIRFAQVFATLCDHLPFVKVSSEKLPTWFIYLLYDGLITTLPTYCENEEKIDQRESWTIQQLHHLLEIEQVGLGENLLFAIFDRQNISVLSHSHFKYFFMINGLLSYIQEHITLFKQLPTQGLAILGQMDQLKYIQKHMELQLPLADFITMQALNTNKQINQLATEILFSLPRDIIQIQLQHFLTSGSVKQRSNSAVLLARIVADPIILQQALADETNKTVITAIESALTRLESANTVKRQSDLIIPDFKPLIDTPLPISARDLLQQNFQEFLIECEKDAQKEIEGNQKNGLPWFHLQERYQLLKKTTSKDLDNIFEYLNGKIEHSILVKKIKKNIDFRFLLRKKRLQNLPEFTLFHLLRATILVEGSTNMNSEYCFLNMYRKYDVIRNFDLRQIADVFEKLNYYKGIQSIKHIQHIIAIPFLTSDIFHDVYETEPYKLWAFFAENEFLLDEALGFARQQKYWFDSYVDRINAIKILTLFPIIPVKYVTYLFELALDEPKQIRHAAQNVLSAIPNIHNQVEQALSSAKQEVRLAAAEWLAELGNKNSIEALIVALKKEKREIVQAAILIALEKMDEDISRYLTAKQLLTAAQKGLKGKKSADFDWFDFNLIPTLTWQNGDKVDTQIIEWWICLAFKLKDPSHPLFITYTRLLSKQSQQQLGEFILQSFIQQDTLMPTIEEAEAQASSLADKRLQQYMRAYQRYPKHYPHYNNITYEQVFDEIKNQILANYLGSAIKAKGILSLTSGIKGLVAVSLITHFMRDHSQRRAQIEAILEPMAYSNDPFIIQLLLSLARRYRVASIQDKAKKVVEHIAQRSGWSTDELADRTISTAGLDDNGLLLLDYGERTFIASLDEQWKWQLKNAEGEKLKALPEARNSENPELVKEAKKQFNNSKKELSQLLTMQSSRFYEAMCAQRQWRMEDWQKYLQNHPFVGRLIQGLVWLQLDKNGHIVNSFRPTENSCLVTNQNDEIFVDKNHFITLAHSALMSSTDIAQWQVYFKYHKLIQLFDQFNHPLPDISKIDDGIINDRLGWLTDSFTIRGILTKLGYRHGDIEDGGSFYGYYKYFANYKLYINIDFSGSMLPEENIPVVLYNLYFSKTPGFIESAIALDNLPKVLLAEGYANYMAVADASNGFDPNWQDKLIW
ncbi:hypothetical protein B6D03_05490 [Gilliamella apicola]|nr:hypothetical protein B6D03_05490 [Gilliamella apicola]